MPKHERSSMIGTTNNVTRFTLEEKVTESEISELLNDFSKIIRSGRSKETLFVFNISNVEWIANQELLVLTGLFKYLVTREIPFKVTFLVNGFK